MTSGKLVLGFCATFAVSYALGEMSGLRIQSVRNAQSAVATSPDACSATEQIARAIALERLAAERRAARPLPPEPERFSRPWIMDLNDYPNGYRSPRKGR